jgi:nitrogen fixation protein NifQ
MDAVLTPTPTLADVPPSAQRFARALLHHAPPGHPDAGFFATVIGTSLAHQDLARSGLCPDELQQMLDHLFPGALASDDARLAILREQAAVYALRGRGDPQPGFTLLLRVLLDAYRAPEHETTPWVTGVLVHACLRPDHLWRDLGLSGREDVTFLLARHYPGLVIRNVRNLRWKKFLAYSACEHAGLPPSAAPGCPACEDYGVCYRDAPD